MSGRLTSKVAVIIGGGSGLGRASVFRFLNEGATVIIADLNEANGMTAANQADVSSEPDIVAAIDLAVSAFGRHDRMTKSSIMHRLNFVVRASYALQLWQSETVWSPPATLEQKFRQ
jgi:NAD(P)-dependent dehydrogenase (short-subunit alcohol dehydrogenase family)